MNDANGLDRSHADPLHECADCGRFQSIGRLRPGEVAACSRCGSVLRRRRRHSLTTVLALSLTGLALMVVAAGWPLLTFRLTGQERMATLLTLPVEFERQGMGLLAITVLATTLVAPVLRLGATAVVIAGLRTGLSRGTLAMFARVQAWLKPWAMVDVFLLGLFVAYTRLQALATVHAGLALVALLGLMLVTVTSDAWLDEHAMWEAIGRRPGRSLQRTRRRGALIGCGTCGLVCDGAEGDACPRCETPVRRRKRQSLARTWALLIAAAVMYVPANLYPVLTVVRLGRGAPSTILGGVEELVAYRMWPLAALVFAASILVPMLKLVGLTTLLVSTQRGTASRLQDRTRLYRIVDVIGRWSMIDVFMVSLLTALVRMGLIGSVTPGLGAVFFGSVVILTMLATINFDPRLMWDAATDRIPVDERVSA